MTTVNIEKRKIFPRRRDGQVAQGGSVAVSVSSSSSSSGTGEFNPAVLQDYAKKVDVHVPSQKALLDALSVEAGYIKYQAAALSIDNADKLGGVVAASYARRDAVNTYEYDQTINADLYINGNIIQNGSAYVTHAEQVEVESNLMQLNVGEPGSQITGVIPGTAIAFSGIEINRGTPDPYYMGVVEGSKPLLKLGKKDSLEAIATRADDISDDFLLSWDLAGKRIIGQRLASDYWHKDNLNKSNVDFIANKVTTYDQVKIIDNSYTEPFLYKTRTDGSHAMGMVSKAGALWGFEINGNEYFEIGSSGTKTTGTHSVTGSVVSTATTTNFVASGTESQYQGIAFKQDGVNRWQLLTPNNATKNLNLYSYNDDGSFKATMVEFIRSGKVQFNVDTKTVGNITLSDSGGNQGRYIKFLRGSEVESDGRDFRFLHDYGTFRFQYYSPSNIWTNVLSYGTTGIAVTGTATTTGGYQIGGTTVVDSSRNIVNVNDGTFSGYVGSPDYASGLTGADWRITKSGFAEFDEVEIRKGLTVHELIVARERSVNGGIITSVANGTVKSVSGDVVTLKGQYNSFVVGDRVRMQQWETGTRYFEAEVIAVSNMTITLGNYTTIGRPQANDDLVQWGHVSDTSRQNFLYQTARGSNAAYFAVMQGVNSSSLTDKQVLRIGNLGGYANAGYGIASKYGGKTYFELSNTTKSIAGWTFTENRIIKGFWEAGAIDINSADRHIQVGHSGQNRVVIFGELPDSTYGIEGRNFSNSTRYFKLSSSGNEIAGITFDHEKQTAGNVQIWKTGDIINTASGTPYAFYGNGNFSLGKGQIGYNAATNVLSFADSVKLQWQNYTNSAIDGLQIGGTNLLSSSDIITTSNFSTNGDNYTYHDECTCYLEAGVQYIVSGVCPDGLQWDSIHGDHGSTKALVWLRGADGSHKIISSTTTGTVGSLFTVSTNQTYTLRTNVYLAGQYVFSRLKIEKGNKVTDWSPAPQDKDSDWVTTITNDTIKTTSVLAENLRVNAAKVEGLLTAATIDASKIVSGYISTARLESLSITGDKIAAGTITTTKLAAYTITAEKIATGTITADKLNTASVQASLITTDYIEGMELNFTKGTIGGFTNSTSKLINSNHTLVLDAGSGDINLVRTSTTGASLAFGYQTDVDGSFVNFGWISAIRHDSVNNGIRISTSNGYDVKVEAGRNFEVDADAFNVNCAANFNDALSVSGKVTVNNTLELKGAVNVKTRIITSTTTLTNTDYYATVSMSSSSRTVYLPNSPTAGRVIKVKRRGGSQHPIINGNGKSIYWMDATPVSSIEINWRHGAALEFIYDGVYWCVMSENY